MLIINEQTEKQFMKLLRAPEESCNHTALYMFSGAINLSPYDIMQAAGHLAQSHNLRLFCFRDGDMLLAVTPYPETNHHLRTMIESDMLEKATFTYELNRHRSMLALMCQHKMIFNTKEKSLLENAIPNANDNGRSTRWVAPAPEHIQ